MQPDAPTTPVKPTHPLAPAAVRATAAVEVLNMIQDGEVQITLPAFPPKVPGKRNRYGKGVGTFEVRPGTTVTLKLRVEMQPVMGSNGKPVLDCNGQPQKVPRLVPGVCRATFVPALVNMPKIFCLPPLNLGQTTVGLVLKDNGTIDAEVIGWCDPDVTRDLLGVARLPLDIPSIYAMVQKQAQSQDSPMAMDSPFDDSKYNFKMTNCTLLPKALPLPAHNGVQVTLAPGTRVNMHATPDKVQIEGDFNLAQMNVNRDDVKTTGTQAKAKGRIDLTFASLSNGTRRPSKMELSLTGLSTKLGRTTLKNNDGTLVTLTPETAVEGASMRIRVDLQKDRVQGPLTLDVPKAVIALEDSTLPLRIPGQKKPSLLAIQAARFEGSFSVNSKGVSLNARSSTLSASTTDVSLGDGMAEIDYASVHVSGAGKLKYKEGVVTFDGVPERLPRLINPFSGEELPPELSTLRVSGTLGGAKLGRSGTPFNLEAKAGTTLDLATPHFQLGGKQRELTLTNGNLALTLKRGDLQVGGVNLGLHEGSRAHVHISKLVENANGLSLRGDLEVEIDAHTQLDPKKLGAYVVIRKPMAASGKQTIVLKGITLDINREGTGTFQVGPQKLAADWQVARIEGRFTAAAAKKLSAIVSSASGATPKLATADVHAPVIRVPTIEDMAAIVQSGKTSALVELPTTYMFPGATTTVGGRKITLPPTYVKLPIAPGTTAEVTFDVKGGEVDYGSIGFVLRGPRGKIVADAHSNSVIDKCIRRHFGGLDLKTLVSKTSDSSPSGLSFNMLRLEMSDVRLKPKVVVALGQDSYLTPGPKTKLALHVDPKITSLSGDVELLDGALVGPGTNVGNVRGSAKLFVTMTPAGDVGAIVSNLDASVGGVSVLRSNGDKVDLSAVTLRGADVTLAMPKKGAPTITATLPQISATLGTSRLTADMEGTATPFDIGGGKVAGSLHIAPGSFNGTLSVDGVSASAKSLAFDAGGIKTELIDPRVSVTGELDFASAGMLRFHAKKGDGIKLAAHIKTGRLGGSQDPFNVRLSQASAINVTATDLAIGRVAKGDTQLKGRAAMSVVLKSGRITLGGVTLDLVAGSSGRIDMYRVEHKAGDAFGNAGATMRFRARSTIKLPKDGLRMGNIILTRVTGSKDEVEVTLKDVQLSPNGKFVITGAGVSLDVDIASSEGRLAG